MLPDALSARLLYAVLAVFIAGVGFGFAWALLDLARLSRRFYRPRVRYPDPAPRWPRPGTELHLPTAASICEHPRCGIARAHSPMECGWW